MHETADHDGLAERARSVDRLTTRELRERFAEVLMDLRGYVCRAHESLRDGKTVSAQTYLERAGEKVGNALRELRP